MTNEQKMEVLEILKRCANTLDEDTEWNDDKDEMLSDLRKGIRIMAEKS